MPRKEEVQPKKKSASARSTADEQTVPKSKLDLSIRDSKAAGKDKDKKKGAAGDANGKAKDSKAKLAAAGLAEPEKKPAKGKKAPAKQPESNGDYLDGLDLPSSSESEDEPENGRHEPLYTAEDKRNDELSVRVRFSQQRRHFGLL